MWWWDTGGRLPWKEKYTNDLSGDRLRYQTPMIPARGTRSLIGQQAPSSRFNSISNLQIIYSIMPLKYGLDSFIIVAPTVNVYRTHLSKLKSFKM